MLKKLKKLNNSIVVKSLAGTTLLITIFSVIVCTVGYHGYYTNMMNQYSDAAFVAANMGVLMFDSDKIDDYLKMDDDSQEYMDIKINMGILCDCSDMTFVYVIVPDTGDYEHITFVFSSENLKYDYERYPRGYVRKTTNDEYREKYRRIMEGLSDKEVVVREKGKISTDPHITAMIPVRSSSTDEPVAILCVQRQLDEIYRMSEEYVRSVISIFVVLAVYVMIAQGMLMHFMLLRPVRRITKEAERFAEENRPPRMKLTESIKVKDEMGILAGSIDSMELQICSSIEDMKKITAEKERISTELSLASSIQSDMLPNKFPLFPERTEFDVFASMDPAREVGGDFYDFFMVDDDRLCIVIADVSGKGIPAALFMMASKIVISDNAKSGLPPAKILENANRTICENNREDMFVTVWLGILEISTGRLTAANAGHEYPIIMQPGEPFTLYKDKHGFIMGGMSGVKYKEYELTMKPGSKIFLYTDGVTEATDAGNDLFGVDRLTASVNSRRDDTPREIIAGVRKDVDGFVKDAEQFDDLTMVCVEYKGTAPDNKQEKFEKG